jgi:hypothetical protein
MNLQDVLTRFTHNAQTISALAHPISPEQARWKPSPDEWSILEVVCHLYDEEREDFRRRVDLLLHDPNADWPPIHPSEWVTERGYNQRDLPTMLADGGREREQSLAWLGSLQNPNWESQKTHPRIGTITAKTMLNAWVAHDHLHIRQLNHLHWQWLATQVDPFSLEYAGGW